MFKKLIFLMVLVSMSIPVFAQSVDTAWVRRYNIQDNPRDFYFHREFSSNESLYNLPNDGRHILISGSGIDKTHRNMSVNRQNGTLITMAEQKAMDVIVDDFMVNDDTACGCYHDGPVIAKDPSGNFVIAWEDKRNLDSLDRDIYAQRYNPFGDFLGSNFRVNDDTGDASQECPCDLDFDGSGNFLIIFEDHRPPTGRDQAQWYDSNGDPIGSNFVVNYNSDTALVDTRAIIGMDHLGNYILVWTDGRGTPWPYSDIYAQRYEYPHTPLGTNFKVNDDEVSAYQDGAALAMNGSGRSIICWEDGRNGSLSNYDIYAQRYDSYSSPVGNNFRVNDDLGAHSQRSPDVAMDSAGNFVIVWTDERSSNSDIYAQRYNSVGIPLGSNFRVNDDADSAYQNGAYIAMDSSGRFVITWHDHRSGYCDVYAQRYNADGTPIGNNFLIPNPLYSSFYQGRTRVAATSSSIYFTWEDNRRGNQDIYAKIVDWEWSGICGDLNGDYDTSLSDVVYLISYLFKGGAQPQCAEPYLTCGDANGDGNVSLADIVYLINYLFKGGPPPLC